MVRDLDAIQPCVCVDRSRNGRARVCHSPTVRIKQIDVGRLSSVVHADADARIETGTDRAQKQQQRQRQPGISRALYAVIDYYCYYFSRARAAARAFAHSSHHFVCACRAHPCRPWGRSVRIMSAAVAECVNNVRSSIVPHHRSASRM